MPATVYYIKILLSGFINKALLCIFFCTLAVVAKADHITGGEMFYTTSPGANGTILYSVTLKLFKRCNSGRLFNNPSVVSVFDLATKERIANVNVALSSERTIELTDAGPCVTNPPKVCYVIGTYQFNIALPPSVSGYLLSTQVNFRIAGISNLTTGYSNVGATYTAEIPGTVNGAGAPMNNSASFTASDLVVVCAQNRFSYSFGATDPDGDVLRYSFCNAYVSGASTVGNNSTPPPPPPYFSVPYSTEYGSGAPLGQQVKIDPATGLITGIAPPTGIYVVTVCVEEIRNGAVIATQRKDLQINIAACDIAAAQLEPEYQLCRSTKTLDIINLSSSALIKTQNWQITNNAGASLIDTPGTNLKFTFADTGLYTIKLVINRGQTCSDSSTSIVRVYPGFIPSFTFQGTCFTRPTLFANTTSTVYGSVSAVRWNFGEFNATDDTSIINNPKYAYPTIGSKLPILHAFNSNGCRDTANRIIDVFDKPVLKLAFKDTLICINDSVQLLAGGSGLFNWTPSQRIMGQNSSSPVVYPTSTTKYFVDLDDQGCLNRDTVQVRVTDRVNLGVMPDTTICSGDTIRLNIVSDGFRFVWTPSTMVSNANTASPLAVTNQTTVYRVIANIGSCTASRQVQVSTVPYPTANAGADTLLCFNTSGRLNGSTNGSTYKWTPAAFLSNSTILKPQDFPVTTTRFILSAFDTKGCPKPGTDTVVVGVLPKINAYAGNDTAVVTGQELQLNASGGLVYNWAPPIGLSSTTTANPIARFNEPSEGLRYVVSVSNQAGCVDTASLNVKVFGTNPSVFVPSAFTPNSDGNNDVLRPVSAGIKMLEYFSIYNRWGQLMFTTSQDRKGWDGTIAGKPQSSGTFVWIVKAVDYNNVPYMQKGTVVLLR